MKKLSLGIVFTLFALCVTGQQRVDVDYDGIGKTVSDKNYYNGLINRFNSNGTQMSPQEKCQLYYGYVFQDGYKGNALPMNDEVREMLEKKQFQQVWDMKDELLEQSPVSLRMARMVYQAGVGLRLPFSEIKPYYDRCMLLYDIVASSGDGSEQNPYKVICVADEYEFMSSMLKVEAVKSQSIADNGCDIIQITNAGNFNGDHIYFDLSPALEYTAR